MRALVKKWGNSSSVRIPAAVRPIQSGRTSHRSGSAKRPFRDANQSPQGRVDGSVVREMLSHVRRKEHEVCAGSIARGVLAANSALQLRQIVLSTEFVTQFPSLSFFVHNAFARSASSFGRL